MPPSPLKIKVLDRRRMPPGAKGGEHAACRILPSETAILSEFPWSRAVEKDTWVRLCGRRPGAVLLVMESQSVHRACVGGSTTSICLNSGNGCLSPGKAFMNSCTAWMLWDALSQESLYLLSR